MLEPWPRAQEADDARCVQDPHQECHKCADDVATDMTWIKTSCRLYRSLFSSTGPRSAHSTPLVLSPGFDRLGGAQDLERSLPESDIVVICSQWMWISTARGSG